MQRILWNVALTGGAAGLFTALYHWWQMPLRIDMSIMSIVSIALSVMLVFRTNTAYEKWWEGRTQWGNVTNNTRNLAMLYEAILSPSDTQNRQFFAKYLSNFAFSLRDHLRQGASPDNLRHLTDTERAEMVQQKHLPGYLLSQLYRRTQQIYLAKEITDIDWLNVKPHLHALTDAMGACERIHRTPIPFSYNVFFKILITIYCIFLPFGLLPSFGYFTVPIVMLVAYIFVGLEIMADEIEDPFGIDCNDLPIAEIAMNIKNSVYEILKIYQEVQQDMPQEEYQKIR